MVPVGSRDMCSTVRGSYQLSTDPQACPVTLAAQSFGGLVRHNLTFLCPLGVWSRLVPMPSPYSFKPKKKN